MYNFSPLWARGFDWGTSLGIHKLAAFVFLLVIWTLLWKGWALWLAARRHEKVWFIVLLFVNTGGILEIIYIFLFAKRSDVPVDHHHHPHTPEIPPQQ